MSRTRAFIPTIKERWILNRGYAGVSLNKRAHPYYQYIFHRLLTAIILWDILQKNMQTTMKEV